MIAIDTNLLVRHLTQDDPVQSAKVARLLAGATRDGELVLLTDIVLCETTWVLTRFYEVKRTDLLTALGRVLADAQFAFQHRPEVEAAVRASRTGRGHFPIISFPPWRAPPAVTRPTLSRKAWGRHLALPCCRRMEGMRVLCQLRFEMKLYTKVAKNAKQVHVESVGYFVSLASLCEKSGSGW